LCSWTGCSRNSDAMLAERDLCVEHFFEFAYRRMNGIRKMLDDPDQSRVLMGEAQAFLSQVVSQTTQLATQVKLLDPSLRDHLLSLSTGAAELYNRVRRAPRLTRRVPCLLRAGIVSPEIGEPCQTLNISQRGACLESNASPRAGREMKLERTDNQKSALVKISWINRQDTGKYLIGVEILDSEDFWGLGKMEGSPARSSQTLQT